MDDDSTQDIALTPPEMLNEARERLSSALDLLGRYQEALLPDSSLQGAAILARDSSRLLDEMVRVRTEH